MVKYVWPQKSECSVSWSICAVNRNAAQLVWWWGECLPTRLAAPVDMPPKRKIHLFPRSFLAQWRLLRPAFSPRPAFPTLHLRSPFPFPWPAACSCSDIWMTCPCLLITNKKVFFISRKCRQSQAIPFWNASSENRLALNCRVLALFKMF
jgi:hypothetical protein